ncbi:MAG: hypothetical protein JOY62_02420 [Acidobacteriaceae bacterium]|nr:hypothetical protein [Acidobacteriaceae bacterium]
MGSPHQIASEICRLGYEQKLEANLAIASNPDTAILLARNCAGVILVTPGEENFKLASLPLACLFAVQTNVSLDLLETLQRWGLKTCGDLAALPEQGIAERLGATGIYLRNLACGKINRALRIPPPKTSYEERMELEHPIALLEPLLFLFSRILNELCGRLRAQSQGACALEARLELEEQKKYRCELEFPVPLTESAAMLKLLQLHLERHAPEAPILAFTLRLKTTEPRRVQHGFFLPPAPPADKLELTLARIEGMVGKQNVGAPVLLNTHRPDAFQIAPFHVPDMEMVQKSLHTETPADQQVLRLAIRLFRPALYANVKVAGTAPQGVSAPGVQGNVIRSAGPWKTSGEWWASTSWIREEWDVALDDGALYRIYQESPSREWYVYGIYD